MAENQLFYQGLYNLACVFDMFRFFIFFTEGADEPNPGPNTGEVSDAGQFVLSHRFR